ncbi:MAG: hypothetical protein WDN66_04005 [Candidatus Saccharibacteria bacterium]
MPDSDNQTNFELPLSIAQPVTIGLILRELSLIDEHLNQENIRDPAKQIEVKASLKLNELLSLNNIDIADKSQRLALIKILNQIRESAPVVNVSFSTEASEEFIQKIAKWFRDGVDPMCLVIVGMEPSMGAGSIVRTPNKVFDFSLKSQLHSKRGLLEDRIKQLNVEAA